MKKNNGFTLVEMAIVLVVIGLMMAGMFSALRNQTEANRIKETRQAMSDIRDAIIGFTLTNGHLPCPANPTLANTAALAGQEVRTGAGGVCTFLNGVVPWTTLGVKELDAWGKRYTYRVTTYFADTDHATTGSGTCAPSTDASVSFAMCSSPGDIAIVPVTGAGAIPTSVAAIISHGMNMRGAYNPDGGGRTGVALGDELENANDDSTFVDHPFVYADDPLAATYYDDLAVWIPSTILIGKMASANRLP